MKASVLNLHEIRFLKVGIEVNKEPIASEEEYDFTGADLGWNISHGKTARGENVWWVAVSFSNLDDKSENVCPYRIDMRAAGIIEISDSVDQAKREELVFENGAALVYGAIREMVTTVTSRCIHGALVLPTPTFIGEFTAKLQREQTDKN